MEIQAQHQLTYLYLQMNNFLQREKGEKLANYFSGLHLPIL